MRSNTPHAAEAAIMMVGGVLAEGRKMILHYQYVIGQCLDNSIIIIDFHRPRAPPGPLV